MSSTAAPDRPEQGRCPRCGEPLSPGSPHRCAAPPSEEEAPATVRTPAVTGPAGPVTAPTRLDPAPVTERAPSPKLSGELLGALLNNKYQVIELLGRGGMGAVYKARDKQLGRIVALKFIRGGDPSLIMRFLQEARAQARLNHPGICKVSVRG